MLAGIKAKLLVAEYGVHGRVKDNHGGSGEDVLVK